MVQMVSGTLEFGTSSSEPNGKFISTPSQKKSINSNIKTKVKSDER
jgi:hypothetical protein